MASQLDSFSIIGHVQDVSQLSIEELEKELFQLQEHRRTSTVAKRETTRSKKLRTNKRHVRIRKKLFGTQEKPRLAVYKSNKHIYVQLIDDEAQKTFCSFSTNTKPFREKAPKGGTVSAAIQLGEWVAKEAKTKGITQVVFDRAGYLYHGRIKALAEACRKGGLHF